MFTDFRMCHIITTFTIVITLYLHPYHLLHQSIHAFLKNLQKNIRGNGIDCVGGGGGMVIERMIIYVK